MSCPSKTYNNITPELFTKLVQMAASEGLNLIGTSGQAKLHGCTFSWGYDPIGQELTIECIAHSIFFSCGEIDSKLDSLLKL